MSEAKRLHKLAQDTLMNLGGLVEQIAAMDASELATLASGARAALKALRESAINDPTLIEFFNSFVHLVNDQLIMCLDRTAVELAKESKTQKAETDSWLSKFTTKPTEGKN